VVTTMVFAPADPAGVTAVMEVALTTFTLVAATPPTVTLLAPVKLVPVMVIAVPPAIGPDDGLTLAMVGAATYVNVIACDVDPPAVVTTIVFAPAAPAGVTAVIEVASTTTTLVAATPPTVTALAPVKLVPVMVIAVPPAIGPDDGLTLAIVGAATYVNVIACDVDPPAVVTTMVFAPADPAGVTAVMEVALTTTTLVAATPPTVTLLAPVKLVPVMVIAVPAVNGPDDGLTLAMIGAAMYVNPLVEVSLPNEVVTTTSFAPAAPAGVTAVMEVAVATTLVAATPPTVTVALAKLVPLIVIVVPPAVGPEIGLTLVIVGTGTSVYVKALVAVTVPPGVVTATSFAPAVPAGVIAVIEVALTTTTVVAATPPTVTALAPVKLVPVMVMAVPPDKMPVLGLTDAIVGAGAK